MSTVITAVRRASRLGIAALALLVLTTLLGAASTLQPPAAAASEPAASTAHLAPVAPVATSGTQPTRNLNMGCPGPDALCDLGSDAVDCAKDPIDCGKDAAGDVKDGAGDLLDGAGDLLPDGCGILDAICGNIGGLPGLSGVPGLPGIPGLPNVGDLFGGGIPGLGDIPNPFEAIGDVIAKAAGDAWTAAMLAIWNSGLFVLRIVLTFSELFLTPDLSADGPGKDVYAFTLWLALALVVILAMIQLGAAAFKREGKSLARAFIGSGQFVLVCASWFGYCVMIIAACGALTKALMKSLLKVQTWPDWDPLGGLGIDDITDAGVATALAFLGIFLWLAAIGHVLVYLARAASLLVLTATGPLAAAGLVSEFTRSWFWKSLRWFHAAAFTPLLMVMVLGIGVQFANGVAAHLAEDTAKAFGTALPAVMTILISVVAPLSLFKLLAFVDPGTPSGASFRQGMAIQGGLQGLLSGGGAGGGSSAASTIDANGRSSGEQSAEASTGDRFSKSTQGALGSFGPVGQALSTGMGWINSAGAKATSLMSDETNQAGVGQSTYGPDFSGLSGRQSGGQSGGQGGTHPGSQNGDQSDGDSSMPTPPTPPAPPTPQTLPTGGGPGGGSGGQGGGGADAAPKTPAAGGGGAAGGAGGAGAAAGGIPPVAGVTDAPTAPPRAPIDTHRPEGKPTMTTYADYQRDRIGWFFGLSGGQLMFLALASLPAFWAISRGAWFSAFLFALVWVFLLAITVIPVRGRSATGWVFASTMYAVGGLFGWTSFRAKATQGRGDDLDTPDLPGVLQGVQIHDGPPHGSQLQRVAIIEDHAMKTWAVTASIVHPGIGMKDTEERARYGEALAGLLDVAGRTEKVDEILFMVRTVPEDGAERDLWVNRHRRPNAPELSEVVNSDLAHGLTQASVRTEQFVTILVPETRIARSAKESGGGFEGRCRELYLLMAEIEAQLRGPMGMTSVRWLTSPELALASRTGFAPGDRAGIVEALAMREKDPSVNADVPWALAGPSGADATVRHYSHDAWNSISATIKLPTLGVAMGALAPILTPSESGERRSFVVAFPVVSQSKADRQSSNAEWAADLAEGMNEKLGRKTRAKQRDEAHKARGLDAKLAHGNALVRPYAVCTVTVPKTLRITEFGRRLDASIRRAGFAPLRLDLAQDVGFAASTIPVGMSLTRSGDA